VGSSGRRGDGAGRLPGGRDRAATATRGGAGTGAPQAAPTVRAMLLSVAGIVAGLLLLTYAADQFVVGAARLAVQLRLSSVVIGAVVVGFGTSAPELLVSGIAAGRGSLDIAVGNIVGSNVANLSLVLGGAALLMAIPVQSPTLRRETPIMLAATLLFAVVVQGGLTAGEGILLAVALVAALGTILYASRGGDPAMAAEVEEFLGDAPASRAGRESLRTLLGLAFTLVAAQVLVQSATDIAGRLGLDEGFVGLTIVAVGTSLPELATAIQAARKAETDLIVGNLLGSNVFNSLAVGATAAIAGPGAVRDADLTGLAVLLMVGISLVATLFLVTGRRIVRREGVLLIAVYLAVMPLLA
jgi:cation:H+ antiporter